MKTIALIIMVAILLEALVEYVKTIIHMVEEKDYKTAITQAITIALGIFLAFAFHLQLFNNAMAEFYEGLHINEILDMILTGILFSRGSNYFSDLISRLTGKKPENSIFSFDELFVDDVIPQTEKDNEIEDEDYIDESEAFTLEDDDEIIGRG